MRETNAQAAPEHEALPVKLYRTEGRVTVAAPMPGLGRGDIEIEVTPTSRLVLRGHLCADPTKTDCGHFKAESGKDVLLDEWQPGPYERELGLPTPVDGAAGVATFGNGILVVTLPTADTTRPARLTPA